MLSSATFGVSCDVCFEDYNTEEHVPVFFQCGHTFCNKCVVQLSAGAETSVSCPKCCEHHYVKKDEVLFFAENKALLDLLEMLKPPKTTQAGLAQLVKCTTCEKWCSMYKMTWCVCSNLNFFCKECTSANHAGHNYVSFEFSRKFYEVVVVLSALVESAAKLSSADLASAVSSLPEMLFFVGEAVNRCVADLHAAKKPLLNVAVYTKDEIQVRMWSFYFLYSDFLAIARRHLTRPADQNPSL